MMTSSPRERPEHSGWYETLADIERLVAEAGRLELELGIARQDIAHLEAELGLARHDQLGRSTLRWAGQWWVPVAGGGA